jgi:integrase
MRVRHLPQQMDPATVAILPSVRGEGCGCRSLAQDIAIGARQQSQNQKSDERSVFSRDPLGVDGTKSDQGVPQSAKRMRTPDVLTPEEIMALLEKLPEPLRTAAELDAFTGLRRGELIGLQWADVGFRESRDSRSVVMMVQGAPKTEASAKDVPLDAALAESLLKLRLTSPYNRETDWGFASPTMKGKQPLWPDTLWRRYGQPAVKAAEIKKRVAFHTFRHTYTTLLTQNSEDVKVVQELRRHANSRVTLDLYAQAGMQEKREAQSKLVRLVLNKGETLA